MLRIAALILAVALQGTTLATTPGSPPSTVRASTPGGPQTTDRSREWSTPPPSHDPSIVDHSPSATDQTTGQKWSTAAPLNVSSAADNGPSTHETATKQQPLPTPTVTPLHGPSTVSHGSSTGETADRRTSTPPSYSGTSTAYRRGSTYGPRASTPPPAYRPSTATAGGTTGAYHTRGPLSTVRPVVADPDAWTYRVQDGAGQTCIRMSLRAVLSVQYKTVDDETRSVEVPVPETEATGFCHEKEAQMTLAWSNFELRWTFEKIEVNDTWLLRSVQADFKKSEAPFENALINDGGTVWLESESRVHAALGRAFSCPASALAPTLAIAFDNANESQNVTLRVRSLLVQPFMGGDAFSEADTCPEANFEPTPTPSGPPPAPTAHFASSQTPMRIMPYQAPTLQPYVYKKVHSNMVKVYPPKKLMAGMFADQNDPTGSMLWSWYMSGFYTGYYQALQQVKKL